MSKNVWFLSLCSALMLPALVHLTSADAHAERVGRRATVKSTGCQTIIPLGRIIWKGCAASGHLSGDPRGNGAALIAPRGATSLNPPACVPILNYAGTRIGGMQMYAGNNGVVYKWRAYTNYGCGAGLTQSRLRTKSANREIYLQVGRNQCIKIDKAFSNINSSQHC